MNEASIKMISFKRLENAKNPITTMRTALIALQNITIFFRLNRSVATPATIPKIICGIVVRIKVKAKRVVELDSFQMVQVIKIVEKLSAIGETIWADTQKLKLLFLRKGMISDK